MKLDFPVAVVSGQELSEELSFAATKLGMIRVAMTMIPSRLCIRMSRKDESDEDEMVDRLPYPTAFHESRMSHGSLFPRGNALCSS